MITVWACSLDTSVASSHKCLADTHLSLMAESVVATVDASRDTCMPRKRAGRVSPFSLVWQTDGQVCAVAPADCVAPIP